MAPEYTPEQRSRNQLSITLGAMCAIGVVVLSGTLQSWDLGSFVAAGGVILVVAAVFWKLFASREARPLPTDRDHMRYDWRWPYLSKKKMDEIEDQNNKRLGN